MRVPAGWCIVLRDERNVGRGVFDTTEELEAALRAHRLEGEGGVKERAMCGNCGYTECPNVGDVTMQWPCQEWPCQEWRSRQSTAAPATGKE
jgi:hypothetical protein